MIITILQDLHVRDCFADLALDTVSSLNNRKMVLVSESRRKRNSPPSFE